MRRHFPRGEEVADGGKVGWFEVDGTQLGLVAQLGVAVDLVAQLGVAQVLDSRNDDVVQAQRFDATRRVGGS